MGKQHLARGVGRMSEMVMKKGKGSWIWTTDDRKLLDFTSGIAVTNLGHCHPVVTEAVQKQVATLVHAQVNIGYHEPMLKLTDRLVTLMPKGLDSLFFATRCASYHSCFFILSTDAIVSFGSVVARKLSKTQ